MYGAIRTLRSREAGQEIAPEPPGGRGSLAAAFKRMRQEDPPQGTRRLSRALRAQHFRAVLAAGGWGGTPLARVEWAAALVAHNLLLRAGE
eukprot:564783-Pleurochrysis_carterae.AAC.1